ncbi:MAG: hypothetical protein SFV54_26965 [Bryobacteraceae bacterium]|nr:hypothetical protein [Bryobacteraceae bacterium]
MPRTLLALYGELQAAEGAASELAKRIRGAEVSVLTGQPRAEDGAALAGLGVPEGDRAVCEQCLRLGASVVVARVADREADGASEVLERFEPEDLDSLGERFRLDDGAQRDEPMPMRAAGPPAPAAPTPAGPPPTAASAVEERRAEVRSW